MHFILTIMHMVNTFCVWLWFGISQLPITGCPAVQTSQESSRPGQSQGMLYIDIDINKYLGKSIERAENLSFGRVLNPKSYKNMKTGRLHCYSVQCWRLSWGTILWNFRAFTFICLKCLVWPNSWLTYTSLNYNSMMVVTIHILKLYIYNTRTWKSSVSSIKPLYIFALLIHTFQRIIEINFIHLSVVISDLHLPCQVNNNQCTAGDQNDGLSLMHIGASRGVAGE